MPPDGGLLFESLSCGPNGRASGATSVTTIPAPLTRAPRRGTPSQRVLGCGVLEPAIACECGRISPVQDHTALVT
jgi:hypothetical protein